MKHTILFITIFFSGFFSFAAEYYVAPNGNDANTGAINNPVETIKKSL